MVQTRAQAHKAEAHPKEFMGLYVYQLPLETPRLVA